jgi:hypothetical protein
MARKSLKQIWSDVRSETEIGPLCTMRFQVQWDPEHLHTFSDYANSRHPLGVTVNQAAVALNNAYLDVSPARAQELCQPALKKARTYIHDAPEKGGIAQGGLSKSFPWPHKSFRAARVDVVNERGHNLRVRKL